jgi:hypothetical protein
MSFSAALVNYYEAGIALTDSSGKVICFGFATNGGATMEASYYSSPTVQSSIVFNTPIQSGAQFGINDDGTNIKFLISYDGVTSFVVGSVSRTALLSAGPTSIGIFLNAYNQPITMNVTHWNASLPGAM